MEVKLPAHLGNDDINFDRQTDQPSDRQTDWVIGKWIKESYNTRTKIYYVGMNLAPKTCQMYE